MMLTTFHEKDFLRGKKSFSCKVVNIIVYTIDGVPFSNGNATRSITILRVFKKARQVKIRQVASQGGSVAGHLHEKDFF